MLHLISSKGIPMFQNHSFLLFPWGHTTTVLNNVQIVAAMIFLISLQQILLCIKCSSNSPVNIPKSLIFIMLGFISNKVFSK